jgi:hypothetical protein
MRLVEPHFKTSLLLRMQCKEVFGEILKWLSFSQLFFLYDYSSLQMRLAEPHFETLQFLRMQYKEVFGEILKWLSFSQIFFLCDHFSTRMRLGSFWDLLVLRMQCKEDFWEILKCLSFSQILFYDCFSPQMRLAEPHFETSLLLRMQCNWGDTKMS